MDSETLRIKCMAHDFKMINAFANFPMRFRVTHEQMFKQRSIFIPDTLTRRITSQHFLKKRSR